FRPNPQLKDHLMTFCTAHRPAPKEQSQARAGAPRNDDRRIFRTDPQTTEHPFLFTDWASL
ncbi:MAG: hypothetical protein AAGG54_17260, partial [Pseudomonadota bacterium]